MRPRPAFTLFELILAMALSATLLALIGTAVNLYLVRMDSGRTRVEEAQLARSILSTIAADIRATTVYQTQDVSSVEQLADASAAFDPDEILRSGPFESGLGQPSSSTTPTETTESSTTAPGLNGLTNELMLDVARLPRLDELFPAVQQQASASATSTAATNAPRPSDLKSVRYFIRQGNTIEPSDLAATGISTEAQQAVGGLVRQSVDRAIREVAEQSANSQLLNSGQNLLAPEVTQIQFVYFDGTTAVDQWDMQEMGAMPMAVEVRIWIAPDAITAESSAVPLQPQMYSQTVELPLAEAAAAGSQQQTTEQPTEDETEDEDPS
jgi:hypothetical protein